VLVKQIIIPLDITFDLRLNMELLSLVVQEVYRYVLVSVFSAKHNKWKFILRVHFLFLISSLFLLDQFVIEQKLLDFISDLLRRFLHIILSITGLHLFIFKLIFLLRHFLHQLLFTAIEFFQVAIVWGCPTLLRRLLVNRLRIFLRLLQVWVDSLELSTFKVWTDVLSFLYENTGCKLNIESVVNSSTDILLALVKLGLLVSMLTTVRFLNNISTKKWFGILIFIGLVTKVGAHHGAVLHQDGYKLLGNLAVRCALVLDHLFHYLQAEVLETCRHLLRSTVPKRIAYCYGLLREAHLRLARYFTTAFLCILDKNLSAVSLNHILWLHHGGHILLLRIHHLDARSHDWLESRVIDVFQNNLVFILVEWFMIINLQSGLVLAPKRWWRI